jgi:hypothetical protein
MGRNLHWSIIAASEDQPSRGDGIHEEAKWAHPNSLRKS